MATRLAQPHAVISCGVCGAQIEIRDRSRLGRTKFCSKACFYTGRELKGTFQPGHAAVGRPGPRGGCHSDETRARMREINRAKARRGSDNPSWKGGKRTERKQAMGRWEYREWRDAVFQRDCHTCRICGLIGGYLHADHVESWADNEALRYDVSNGQTLCYLCHFEKTFGRRDKAAALRWGVPVQYRGRVL